MYFPEALLGGRGSDIGEAVEIFLADDQIFEPRSDSGDRDRKSDGADWHCF